MDMQHVQRMALMGKTEEMSTALTVALEVLLSILPIDLFIEQETLTTSLILSIINCWQKTLYDHKAV